MKNSYVMYTEWNDSISLLSLEQKGLLLDAIMAYQTDSEMPEMDTETAVCFSFMRKQFDRDRDKYEKRSIAGKQGGAPKGNTNANKQKQAKTSKNKPIYVDDDVDVDVIDNTARTRARESQVEMFDRLAVARALTNDTKEALREWIEYKSEKNERYKETGMKSLITQAVNLGASYGGSAVCDAIRSSMASGYKGIVWDRIKKKSKKPPERNYNMNDLELKLLATN